MRERYIPQEIRANNEREVTNERYPHILERVTTPLKRIRKDWDEGYGEVFEMLYEELFSTLDVEFNEASLERKRDILMERYFDAFAPNAENRIRSYKKRFDLNPQYIDPNRIATVYENGISQDINPKNNLSMRFPVEAYQYGPSVAYSLPPGEIVIIEEMTDQDIIGSSHFTSCSALIAEKGDTYLFAHIPMSQTDMTMDLYNKYKDTFGADNFDLISPKKITADTADPSNIHKELAHLYETNPQIKEHRFPYISIDSLNPHGIESTSVLFGPSIRRIVGVTYDYEQQQYGPSKLYSKIHTDSIVDF